MENIKLPWSFVKNQGQEDARAYFTTDIAGRRIFFSSDRLTFVELENMGTFTTDKERMDAIGTIQNGVALELSFLDSDPNTVPEGVTQLEGHHHYFKKSDPSDSTTNVLRYEDIRYPSVWAGVALEVDKSSDGLKMNWVIDQPSNLSSIQLHWEGADSIEIDAEGNLLIHHVLGTMIDKSPIAYQEINGEKVSVDCTYRIDSSFDYGFNITGTYDQTLPIIIDPIIQYTTLLGGSTETMGEGVDADVEGCAYITGETYSMDFPTTPGAFQTTFGGINNAFVTKFSSDGSSLIYSTFIGGTSWDSGMSIAVDDNGYAYITGYTSSTDFPVTPNAFQTVHYGYTCAFVTKIDQNGESLIYSTFLSGSLGSSGRSITVDNQGHAYTTGSTFSQDFPVTPGAFQTTFAGSANAYITKFAPDGESLIFSTYLGGIEFTEPFSITLDSQNCVCVAGETTSSDFPVTPGVFQETFPSTQYSGFITKFTEDGGSLIFSTYLGGSENNIISSIAIGPNDYVYVTGQTTSPDFPITPDAVQTTFIGRCTFVSILTTDGSQLVASTFLGGMPVLTRQIDSSDSGYGIAVDRYGYVYVTGKTRSPDFPTTPDIFPSSFGGFVDAYVTILSTNLTSLVLSFFLGGSGLDRGNGISLKSGYVYIVGTTDSDNFPTTEGAYQEDMGGSYQDAFLTKLASLVMSITNASFTIIKLNP